MKRLLSICAALALVSSTSAFAMSHKAAPDMAASGATAASGAMTKQQSKMSDCSKENKGKKGDEYKAAMKSCLSTDKPMTQQQKMSACSKENKGKKGDEYKAAQKACLSA